MSIELILDPLPRIWITEKLQYRAEKQNLTWRSQIKLIWKIVDSFFSKELGETRERINFSNRTHCKNIVKIENIRKEKMEGRGPQKYRPNISRDEDDDGDGAKPCVTDGREDVWGDVWTREIPESECDHG